MEMTLPRSATNNSYCSRKERGTWATKRAPRFSLLAMLVLAGCARQPMSPERIIETYAPICDQLGFERNTDPWRNCILSRYDAARADRARRAAGSSSCTFVGSTMICN